MDSTSEVARTGVAFAYVLVIVAFGFSGYFMIDSIARANESLDRVGQIIAESSEHDYDSLTQPDVVIPATPTSSKPQSTIPTKPAPVRCYVGGCSGQLCSSTPDMVSTCEWRESYACYAGATCELQSNGVCGWTMDTKLAACLDRAR